MKDQVRSMTERGMTAMLVHECSEQMVGNVCIYLSLSASLSKSQGSIDV